MASRKTIELKFGDDNSTFSVDKPTSTPKETVKKMEFNGFVIEVMETTKSKEPNNSASSGLKITPEPSRPIPSNSQEPLVLSALKDDKTINRSKTEDAVGLEIDNLQKARSYIDSQLKTQTQTRIRPIVAVKPSQHENAPQMNRKDCHKVEETFTMPNQSEAKVEPPPFTQEDIAIFKQFMEPVEPRHHTMQTKQKIEKLQTNLEAFVCPICKDCIKRFKGAILQGCSHNFCRLCLIDHIQKNHDKVGQVKCPLPIKRCQRMIEDEEVKELLGEDYGNFALKIVEMLQIEINARKRIENAARAGIHPALLDAENQDFIENFEAFECQICYVEADIGEGIILKNCHHSFCKVCLIDTVRHSEDIEVKCPHIDDHGSCKFIIQQLEIRKIVPQDVFDKYLEKSLKLFKGTLGADAYHCKTPDCNGFVEVNKDLRGFMCPACKAVNCIGCKAIHTGKNCLEYQDEVNPDGKRNREDEQSEAAIKNLISADQALYCPGCGIPVMKDDGCDYIVCTTCQLGICWRMKKPRQPLRKINGEFIDGCHCRENGGPSCHPLCGTCH